MQQSKKYITCLTVAGSDSGGGAGIQADLKTFSSLGVYGTSAITAITAQNTCGVIAISPIAGEMVKSQIDAVLSDIGADAIKIGMLHSIEVVHALVEMLDKYRPPIVVFDPVMVSTSGHRLIEESALTFISKEMFHRVDIITPNTDEASLLSGVVIRNQSDIYSAGEILLQMGCRAVLIKGGHLEGNYMNDILFTPHQLPKIFSEEKINTCNTHGTGCTLSAAIAAFSALGNPLDKAVFLAKQYLHKAIREGANIYLGKGHGSVNHNFSPSEYIKINRSI